jgi:hypothetical protein
MTTYLHLISRVKNEWSFAAAPYSSGIETTLLLVRFEVFTAVRMIVIFFWVLA